MFKLRKWTMALILVFLAIFLVACNKEKRPDKEVVMDVVEFLKQELPDKVRGDFIIPEYKKNKNVVIEVVPRTSKIEEGVWLYDKPEHDYKEYLDIKVSYGSYQTAFTYFVVIFGKDSVGDISDFDRFDTGDSELRTWAEELGKDVTQNIEIPATAGGLDITWFSDKGDILSTEGVYVRPNDDTLVKLTALMKGGAATYSTVLVFNAKGFTQEEKINYLIEEGAFKNMYNKSGTTDLLFPSKTSRFNVEIDWKSSNPEVLSHTGEFLNPDEDAAITITATVRYKMTLADPEDPTKGYKKLDEVNSFEQVVEIPYTVKALATILERATYAASKAYLPSLPKHFYYGKVDGNAIVDLPTEIEEFEDITISWKGEEDIFEYDAETSALKLVVQPLLFKESSITMVVSDGTDAQEVDFSLNIGFLEKGQIGLSVVSGVTKYFDIEAYNEANGFGNFFDGGANVGWDFTFGGLVFKSTFRWYHDEDQTGYTETDFFFFFRHNAVTTITESNLVAEGEGEDVKYRIVNPLSAVHSGSHLKAVYNSTDKPAVISADKLKANFGFAVGVGNYQLYIYDAEGNQTLAHPGAQLADPEKEIDNFEYVIPAGGYIIERGYINPDAANAFFSQAIKVEYIKLPRHPKYGG